MNKSVTFLFVSNLEHFFSNKIADQNTFLDLKLLQSIRMPIKILIL